MSTLEVALEALRAISRKGKEGWSQTAASYMVISERLKLDAPITVSRGAFLPIMVLFMQAVVILLLSSNGLGFKTGVAQFVITLLCVFLLVLHQEGLEVKSRQYQNLSKIEDHNPTEAPPLNLYPHDDGDDEEMLPR